ncbi:hypothetical protein FGB62_49g13 [Gracilaria domingensis]|nr:hypothetical protein FGB62_49g13 [Gracilaria domingensis]
MEAAICTATDIKMKGEIAAEACHTQHQRRVSPQRIWYAPAGGRRAYTVAAATTAASVTDSVAPSGTGLSHMLARCGSNSLEVRTATRNRAKAAASFCGRVHQESGHLVRAVPEDGVFPELMLASIERCCDRSDSCCPRRISKSAGSVKVVGDTGFVTLIEEMFLCDGGFDSSSIGVTVDRRAEDAASGSSER